MNLLSLRGLLAWLALAAFPAACLPFVASGSHPLHAASHDLLPAVLSAGYVVVTLAVCHGLVPIAPCHGDPALTTGGAA